MRISHAIPSTDCHRIPTGIQADIHVPVIQAIKLVFLIKAK